MKKNLLCLVATVGLWAASGCANLELSSVEGDPNRVLTGTVNCRDQVVLPPDAKVVVRVVDAGNPGYPSQVLGDQELLNVGQPPIAYRVEFKATDAQLRHGLNVEARISYGGKVRYFNLTQFGVNSDNLGDAHVVWVDTSSR